MTKTRKAKRINPYIGWLIIGLIGVINFLITQSGKKGFIWLQETVNRTSSASTIWTRSNIYIEKGSQPMMVSLDGKLIILGSDDISKTASIIAFDRMTGNMVWQSSYNGMSIAKTESTVIVGGAGNVTALDSTNGKTLWKTNVLANVVTIIPQGNILYVIGAGAARYYVLDTISGNILEKVDGAYSGWEYPELDDIGYSRTGDGDVVAINNKTGQYIWRNKVNAISNVVLSPPFVYSVDQSGDLLRLNLLTGYSESIIKFKASPLSSKNTEQHETDEYAFFIATDIDSGVIFSYFGDSAQLFANKLE